MEDKNFLENCEFIKSNLVNLEVNRVFNSIGSNIFIEFGKEKELVFKNNRKFTQKEWSIWISGSSWRITKDEKYIVGSGDSSSLIQKHIQQLLGKRFRSFNFLSSFLDVEFCFEDNFRLATFFNCFKEDQWVIFFPPQKNIGVDIVEHDSMKNILNRSKKLNIIEKYKNIKIPQKIVTDISFNQQGQPCIYFEDKSSIKFINCTWRLEKNKDYEIGYLENNQIIINDKLSQIIGKKLEQVDIIEPMFDARFLFQDHFIIKTFSCCKKKVQWEIFYNRKLFFLGQIQFDLD